MRGRSDFLEAIGREARDWNADRRRLGIRLAALRRLRYHAAAEYLGEQIEQDRKRIETLEAEVASLLAQAAGLDARTAAIDELRGHVAAHDTELLVRRTTDWVGQGRLATDPLVTVVLPTRDRADFVGRAVESVLRQRYERWELIVVDDGSVDDTRAVVAAIDDVRISVIGSGGVGVCGARNVALAAARGAIVTYLDDDNTMHPDWLSAVVWALERRPTVDVVYGAFVVDDMRKIDEPGPAAFPELCFFAYDHHDLVQANIADIGAIAHRSGLAEALFDETFREMGDWDLLLRLTRDKAPLALPVVACFYSTDAPRRLTGGPTFDADEAKVRAKNRR